MTNTDYNTNAAPTIKDIAVLVSVSGGKPKMTQIDRDATKIAEDGMHARDSGGYVKRLWPKHLMQPVITAELAVRNTVKAHTVQYARNLYLLANSLRLKLEDALVQPLKQHQLAVDALFMNYAQVLSVAQGQLGTMFDPSVYPDASSLKAQFKLDVLYFPAPDIASLAIDEFGKTLQQRMDVYQTNMLRDATLDITQRLTDVITTMADKLRRKIELETSTDPTVSKRSGPRFHDSLTENLEHLLDVIPELNFSNDMRLNTIVSEAKRKLLVSNEVLKNGTTSVKTQILSDAEDILKRMAGLY